MNKIDFLLIVGLTLISPLLTGYYFGVLDHDHYLPYLNRLLNPVLYPNDYYFSQPHGNYAWFDYLIVGTSRLFQLDLAWVHLILYLLSLGLFFGAIYALAKTFYRNRSVAVLAVIIVMLPKWAAQIGYLTHQFYFVSRDLSLALSLLGLNFILLKRFKLSFGLLFLAMVVNPSIPIPVVILWPLAWGRKFYSMVLPMDSAWLKTMQERGTYSFPSLWHRFGWGTLVFYLSLLLIGWAALKNKLFGGYTSIIKKFMVICGILFIGHIFISALLPIPVLIQLQLLRSMNYIFILSLIAMAAVLVEWLDRGRVIVAIAAAAAAFSLYFWSLRLTLWHIIIVWLAAALATIFYKKSTPRARHWSLWLALLILLVDLTIKLLVIKPKVSLPGYWFYPNVLINPDVFGSWRQVQDWAKTNTVVESVFLVPPQWSGFRSFSQRGIVADAKDGGLIFYSPDYAQIWQERVNDLADFNQFSAEDFIVLRSRYHFDYLVVTAEHQLLPFGLVYQNQGFSVYKL